MKVKKKFKIMLSKIQYKLFYLAHDTPQWSGDILQSVPIGKAYTLIGTYIGSIQLINQINKLKLEHGNKLWYKVVPRFG